MSKRRILRANDHILNVLCYMDNTIPYVCDSRYIPLDDLGYLIAKFIETGNDVDTIVKDLYAYIDNPDNNVEISEIIKTMNSDKSINIKVNMILCGLGFVFAIVFYLSIIEIIKVNV